MSRANLWRCRREASTSRFIDHESNHLQVCRRKQAARVRDEMKTKGREKEGEATLLSIFLKAFALRYKTHDPTTTVEKSARHYASCMSNDHTRVLIFSLARIASVS